MPFSLPSIWMVCLLLSSHWLLIETVRIFLNTWNYLPKFFSFFAQLMIMIHTFFKVQPFRFTIFEFFFVLLFQNNSWRLKVVQFILLLNNQEHGKFTFYWMKWMKKKESPLFLSLLQNFHVSHFCCVDSIKI